MFCIKHDVHKVTEVRDDAVYSTKIVATIWLACRPYSFEEQAQIAKRYGGDSLSPTTESAIMKDGYVE